MSRLGRERPVSRKERWRGVEPISAARRSWLMPRRRRHCRSRAPNGLTAGLAGLVMVGSMPGGRTDEDSFFGNRLPYRPRRRLSAMNTTLSRRITIAASADAVWEVVGRQFDRIGEWATVIPASAPDPAAAGHVDAPVPGRVCQTGIRLVPQVSETIIAYDEADRSLTYQAAGMPAFVTVACNTWRVTRLDARHAQVTFAGQFQTRGLIGRLARRVILFQIRRKGRHLLDDLKHYVEHGTPSPRKRRQRSMADL
jgi:Polyketide cyclase / dehydrase and lipid transport